ncbi:MICAL-like protein 2a [Salarias fasciatus]|uniref:MICAL-like protein 2a n=1 Tax=Salarias fasciatus TaxID=181472 RepID=UPI001176B687|nr:MICAL-like protein 2 [Salarias fasciatus]
MAAIKALEQWCRLQCEGYRDVAITNMTTSFRSGLAFCALIHKYRPDLIDYDSLRKEDVFENNTLAFQVAEDKLGIPALLDAEDMVALRIPDRLSILTYVSQYYNYFKGRPPMGGVKRPAEGSKEEPSEKKNLPVVAKSFVPKAAIENCLPSARAAQASARPARAAGQVVLAENANKNGTLNSKCVACKSHVHLVQRHFVEGKLFHRSCFKCSECSVVLHAGGYKPGKNPDTFICNAHQSGVKPPPANDPSRTGPAGRAAPSPSSALTAPLKVVQKPFAPAPPSHSWTAGAQKTQAARQKFFQAAPQVPKVSTGNGKPAEQQSAAGRPRIPLGGEDEKNRPRMTSGKKLAEQNFNNNNKRPFTIRSAERRFGDEPSPADGPHLRREHCSQRPAGSGAGRSPSSLANNQEPPCAKAVDKDSARPAAGHGTAKDAGFKEWNIKLKPVTRELGLNDAEAFPEQHTPAFSSTGPPVSISAARPPVGLHQPDPAPFKEVTPPKPPPGPESLGFKHGSRSPVKSSPRQPAEESVTPLTTAPSHGNPSAAKKGKYLSPTNASRPEMRSPSAASYHRPVEQIERELEDIEANVAQLEKEGVELEKRLRSCEEEGEGDILMDPLMVDWFNLIRKKQMYIRKESELVYIARTQELERQQPGVEGELRRLLEKPDHLKSGEERQRERGLLQRLMDIVDGRNAIVEGLDKDRLREVEEDQQLNTMMQNLGLKRAKTKRKSSLSKLFRRRNKRRVE